MAKTPGWYEARVSTKPTELDKAGCDGLYVASIKIHWWHPGCWWSVGWAIVRDLNRQLIVKLIRAC